MSLHQQLPNVQHGLKSLRLCGMQRLGKKLVNAPFKLLFPAGARLMTVRNMPAMASIALAPYLRQVCFVLASMHHRCYSGSQSGYRPSAGVTSELIAQRRSHLKD